MRLRYTATALAHLDEIGARIHEDNPRAAERVFQKIRNTIENLAVFPLIGTPGHVDGTLEFVVPGLPYIVVYRVTEDEVQVLSVFHGARDR